MAISLASLSRIRSNCSRSQFPELPRRFSPPQSRIRFSVSRNPSVRLCLSNAKISANDPLKSEDDFSNHETEGSMEKNENRQKHPQKSNEVLDKLRRYGLSGILSYGLLNTAYYLTTFLVVWFYIAPAPAKMGYVAAAGRFLKIMATVWAGSQVTKLARAAGALALAPFVDRGLSWFTVNYNFESQGKAFMAIVGFCLGLALLLFIVVTLLSA
ncbi:hypothetical protein IC582_023384 [Cucumis melo]|uniref:Uncharacterized protein LOC103488806 isoform X5 n=1 Tax=Cucumis melo TaxID=3656 RepID=A0A1S3BDD7_CUCME|nr:uncharacterized protein LOC103488806 isoform X4 [Cucumis melo]XP_008445926.1 uncharacterized protein LOC103488806 isoform X4 [Cucumis melo]